MAITKISIKPKMRLIHKIIELNCRAIKVLVKMTCIKETTHKVKLDLED